MKKISTFALGLMLLPFAEAIIIRQSQHSREAMGKYFLVGAAVNTSLTDGQDPAGEE